MKKMIFVVLAAAALVGCTSQPKYTITGTVEDVEMMYLGSRDGVIDSAVVENGAFVFKGVVEEPKSLLLANNGNLREADIVVRCYLEPGEMTLIMGDDGEYQIAGTPANDAAVAFSKALAPLTKEFEEATPERRDAIYAEWQALQKQTMEQNTQNLLGVELLRSLAYEMSGTELQEVIATFSPEMQASEMMKPMAEMAEKKIKTDIGQPYINFEQANAEGVMVSAQSVIENPANKYVLIDFWASWCGPCMAEVPALKAAYDAYHKKGFEIFGVSLDNKKEAWEAAIKNKELNWLHVSDLQGWQNAAADLYGVRSIPANYLIECSTGKIVGVNLRGEEVAQKVAEVLAE